MNVVLKNYEILNNIEWLKQFMQYELPVKVGWNLTKNMKKFESAWKSFVEFESELVNKYALKDETGKIKYDDNGQPKFAPVNKDKFNKEHNDLYMCENTLDILKIKYSDLEESKIKSSLLFDLNYMIEDDSVTDDASERNMKQIQAN